MCQLTVSFCLALFQCQENCSAKTNTGLVLTSNTLVIHSIQIHLRTTNLAYSNQILPSALTTNSQNSSKGTYGSPIIASYVWTSSAKEQSSVYYTHCYVQQFKHYTLVRRNNIYFSELEANHKCLVCHSLQTVNSGRKLHF